MRSFGSVFGMALALMIVGWSVQSFAASHPLPQPVGSDAFQDLMVRMADAF